MNSREQTLLLGPEHAEFGRITTRAQAHERTAVAISAGSHAVERLKGTRPSANEDALLAIDEGPLTLLTVADAHFGAEASTELLSRLAALGLPRRPSDLFEALWEVRDPLAHERYESETTLLVALLDRSRGEGFGASFGDSSLVLVAPSGEARRLNRKSHSYVTPCRPLTFDPQRAVELRFVAAPDAILLAFTDGIDECNYRRPESSIRLDHIEAIVRRESARPLALAQRLVELALAGVEGNPGGEDNIALVATRA